MSLLFFLTIFVLSGEITICCFFVPIMANRNPSVWPGLLTAASIERFPVFTCRLYDQQIQRTAIAVRFAGQDDNKNITALCATKMWPSKYFVPQWKRRLIAEGTIAPYQHTNNQRARVLKRLVFVLLAYYWVVFPQSLLLEVAAFLWNTWGCFQNPSHPLQPPGHLKNRDQTWSG